MGKLNMKILRKALCHGTVGIALQCSPSLQSIVKTFVALLFSVVPQILITILHLQWKKSTKEFWKKFRKINQIFDQSDNLISCDCYDIPEFKKNENKRIASHIYSQSKYFLHFSPHQRFKKFLNLFNLKIDIICISESRISTKSPQTTSTDLPGHNIEQTPINPLLEGLWSIFPKPFHINHGKSFIHIV